MANSTEDSDFYKNDDASFTETGDFYGQKSGTRYKYHEDSEGFQRSSSYCTHIKFIPQKEYHSGIQTLVDDQILGDRTLMLSLEWISIEASEQVHTLSSIKFDFPSDGSVSSTISVNAMRLSMYRTAGDFLRLTAEIAYVILLSYNIYVFIKKIKVRNLQYKRWQAVEIDSLTDVEKK